MEFAPRPHVAVGIGRLHHAVAAELLKYGVCAIARNPDHIDPAVGDFDRLDVQDFLRAAVEKRDGQLSRRKSIGARFAAPAAHEVGRRQRLLRVRVARDQRERDRQ